MVGVGLAVAKNSLVPFLFHHSWGLAVVLGLTAVAMLLRGKPVATALFAAPAIAIQITASSAGVGIAVGVGAFATLIALFVGVGTLLRLADRRAEIAAMASRS